MSARLHRPSGTRAAIAALLVGAAPMLLCGCLATGTSEGGGQTEFTGMRNVNTADVLLPQGYRAEVVATGLTFPTGLVVDEQGDLYITEAGYSYGEVFAAPRLIRLERDGSTTVIASGDNPPWNGVDYAGGAFYVAEGGVRAGGRILRITSDGDVRVLVDNLPSFGDHHTNGPAVGPDGNVYFGQGTATNRGVVGVDNHKFGWLERHPRFHDRPAKDVVLAGVNFTTPNPLTPDHDDDTVTTGAFSPFGVPSTPGQVVRGGLPASGTIMRVDPRGGDLELIAWGLRNPFGLAFNAAGELYVTENQFDTRGSRPVFGAGDLLWRIEPGAWFGWPDFHGGERLDRGDRYAPPDGEAPRPLLAEHPGTPPRPVSVFAAHSSSNGLAFSTSESFGHVGDAFVAQFGDMAPDVGRVVAPVGFRVVRVDVRTGAAADFAVNRSESGVPGGPASRTGGGGLERPVAVRFSPDGSAMYIVDFGVMTMSESGPRPREGTGVIWRITRETQP